MAKTKVMIVEDQNMPRQLFEMLIEDSEHYETAVSIDNAAVADIYCMRGGIDLVLMDVVTKNGANGLEAAERIKRADPRIKVIIVTSMPEYSYIERARDAGVDSFWYKEISRETILSIMDRTMAGESVYPDRIPMVRVGEASSYDFSRREYEVLRELLTGATNVEIGKHLYISPDTVKKHIQHMLDITGFHSRFSLNGFFFGQAAVANTKNDQNSRNK